MKFLKHANEDHWWKWDVRESYWFDKDLTQVQFDALWDWCEIHNKWFPY